MSEQEANDPWDIRKLGWRFGRDGSALVALRGCLERSDVILRIGRNTLYDALREYSEMRGKRDDLREALDKVRHELGVPGEGYPANVANAYEIAGTAIEAAS